MRLSNQTRDTIRETVLEIFGPDCTVFLFGSRVDDATRGGDIDLLVKSEKPIQDSRRKALQLVARLQIRLGDQRIDVLVVDPEIKQQPIHREAIRMEIAT